VSAIGELRRRLELVADAEHEVRGAVTALAHVAERMRRDPVCRRRAEALEPELARLRVALADLAAAREGRRAAGRSESLDAARFASAALSAWKPALQAADRDASFRWERGDLPASTDPGRLGQVLGNLLANAVEHGGGPVAVSGRSDGEALLVEVRSGAAGGSRARSGRRRESGPRGRGRGLSIAAAAAEAAGGSLSVAREGSEFVATLVLPAARSGREAGRDGAFDEMLDGSSVTPRDRAGEAVVIPLSGRGPRRAGKSTGEPDPPGAA
jgi:signal transduction histidine kinase